MSGWLLTEDASSEEEEGYLDMAEVMYRCCEMVWLICFIEENTALRENEDMVHTGTLSLYCLFSLLITLALNLTRMKQQLINKDSRSYNGSSYDCA